MAKTIFSGAEDSGKSYQLALHAGKIVERNARWLKITGKPRPLISNLEFQPWFEKFADDRGIPIKYWRDIEQLPELTNADLIIDEVGSYFDSRTFKDLPLDVRLWLAQASKLGVDIYGSAQDFAQVDISFRRLVQKDNGGLFHITKLIGSDRPADTKPPVTRIWGVCSIRELDPVAYDEESKKFSGNGFPSLFYIRKEICNIFDTTKRIAKTKPPPYKHVVRPCVDPSSKFKLYENHEGRVDRVSHV